MTLRPERGTSGRNAKSSPAPSGSEFRVRHNILDVLERKRPQTSCLPVVNHDLKSGVQTYQR